MTTKGIKFSEEVRKKRSEMIKKLYANGKMIPFWTGKRFSEEHRKKISEGNKGKIRSKEVRMRMSEYWTGKKRPEQSGNLSATKRPEVREKIRLTKLGSKNGMYGRHYKHKEETKRKISENHKKLYQSGKFIRYWKGKLRPDMSLKMKKLWQNPEYREKVLAKCMIKKIPTRFESFISNIIQKNNLPYKYVGNGNFWIGRLNPDFVNVNGEKTCIEVYYSYYKLKHHPSIEEFKKDRSEKLARYGWKVVFIDENELDEKTVLQKIEDNDGRLESR